MRQHAVPVQSIATAPVSRVPSALFFALAGLVACIDLGSKELAARSLGQNIVEVSDRLALLLVYNTGGAGGFSFGPATVPVNMLVTLAAIVVILMIVPELSRLHRMATPALALVTGGAVGNLASMMVGPAGVADFLAVHLGESTIVFNVADVALWSGASMLVPVVVFLVGQIRLQRRMGVSQTA